MSDFRLMKPVPGKPLFVPRIVLYAMTACGSSVSGVAAVEGESLGDGPVGLGKATLHWESPTVNSDGSSLNDLAGFRVYYGTVDPLTKENARQVNVDKAVTSKPIEALSPGTYFFAVTAIDTSGNESAFSEVVSADISGI